MESIKVTGVLQEAGDADSRAPPDCKCKLNISSFLTLPHYQIASFVPEIVCPLYCYYEWCGDGIVGEG